MVLVDSCGDEDDPMLLTSVASNVLRTVELSIRGKLTGFAAVIVGYP